MDKAHEQSNLIVGKYYLVAHVKSVKTVEHYYMGSKESYSTEFIVPVIPILHDDKQFDFEHKHYHIDGRFHMEDRVKREFSVFGRKTSEVVTDYKSDTWNITISDVFYLRRKCQSLETGLPIDENIARMGVNNVSKGLKLIIKWMDTMVGKSCKGRICPHKGAIMQEVNGKLICPMHNLMGCAKTEKIIRQPLGQPAQKQRKVAAKRECIA